MTIPNFRFLGKPIRLKLVSLMGLMIMFTAGCGEPEPSPTLVPAKTLPSTWTAAPPSATPDIPTPTPIQQPSPIPQPSENWWAVSIKHGAKFIIYAGHETSSGEILLIGQEYDQGGDISRDILLKLTSTGQLVWEKTIYPTNARVEQVQTLENGQILLTGYLESELDGDYPFYLQLSEDGEELSQAVHQKINPSTNTSFIKAALSENSLSIGGYQVKGDLPGKNFISDYAIHPDGGMTLAGSIHGEIKSGGTFSVLTGIWAIRFNEDNQIAWQRFFETRGGPMYFGNVLPDGSVILAKSSGNYDSIYKLDPEGYPIYTRHYSDIYHIRGLSSTSDGSMIIANGLDKIIKLDPEGAVSWAFELIQNEDRLRPIYAFEIGQGELILVSLSDLHGTIISRQDILEPFASCPELQSEKITLEEYFPLPPINLSGSVRVTPNLYELKPWEEHLSFQENSPELYELCRYQDP